MTSTSPLRLLVVTDRKEELSRLRRLLAASSRYLFEIEPVASLDAVTTRERLAAGDLVLVDQHLATPERVQYLLRTTSAMVIVLLDDTTPEQEREWMAHGAVDCIARSELSTPLLERVFRYALEQYGWQGASLQPQLESVLNQVPVMVIVTDAEGRFLWANDEWVRVYEWTLAEARSRAIFAEIFPDPDDCRAMRDFLRAARPGWKELRSRTRSGRILETSWANVRLTDQLRIGFARDMTERRQAEKQFRQVISGAQCLLWHSDVVERDGRLSWRTQVTNEETAQELTGIRRTPGKSWAEDWYDSVPKDEQERLNASSTQAILGGAPGYSHEYRYVRASGEVRWLHEDARIERLGPGRWRVVGISADITERKLAEQSLREREAQLRQAQKMEAIGRLAGGIAHDFNNMLAVINGYSDLLLQTNAADENLRGVIQEIYDAGQRAADLTRQLLAFSRKQVLAPKLLCLNDIAGRMESMLQRLIGEGLKLVTHFDPQLGSVRADPSQIEQVLMNLVVNARDAMPHGGTITIRTRNLELDEAAARAYPGCRAGSYAALSVQDAGTGMSSEVRAQVFEPFYTTKEQGKGTGLGLATVYGIIKQSGGYIYADSEPGQGSVFTIFLPRENAAPQPVVPPRNVVLPSGKETILLLEDEPMVRTLVHSVLVQCGYTVLEPAEGESVLETIRQYPGPIHLLLSDVVMPHVSGIQIAEWMRRFRPEARVLYMSGYTEEAALRQELIEERAAFLPKPFSTLCLARKVREVLDTGNPTRQGTVLVVDDDVAARESLAEILREEGYEVAAAADGQSGLAYLRDNPETRLVLLDLVMPGMNGWVFRIEQRKDPALAAIPVIVLSGEQEPEAAADFLAAAAYFRKPVDIPALLQQVRRLLTPWRFDSSTEAAR